MQNWEGLSLQEAGLHAIGQAAQGQAGHSWAVTDGKSTCLYWNSFPKERSSQGDKPVLPFYQVSQLKSLLDSTFQPILPHI